MNQTENNRILIVTTSLSFGGLSRMARNIANHYVEKGWEVGFALLMGGNEEVRDEIDDKIRLFTYEGFDFEDVRKGWKKRFTTFSWIKFIRKTIKEYKPTVVLAMALKIGALTSLAANMKDRPRIVMREKNDPKSKGRSRFMDRILYRCCKRVDGIIFQTNWEKSCYPKKFQKKGKVIPNPVILDERAISPKKNTFVAMSALERHKAVDVVIKAFGMFSKDRHDYQLEIYGKGKGEESLKTLTRELNLEDKVIFKGPRKDVHSLIKDAKGFVTASEHEGLSNSLLEAFLMGIPCISSDWHGVEDVIVDGENGLLVKIGDVAGFANAFRRLAEDPALCEKLSSNAVKEWPRFDAEEVFKQYSFVIEGE